MTLNRLIVIIIALGVVYGGKTYFQNKDLEARRLEVAKIESSVFNGAEVIVHGVYRYEAESFLKLDPGQRLVAVDVELKGVKPGVDLNDIDIVDAAKNENFGSDPDIIPLDEDKGTTCTQKNWPKSWERVRMLLVYAVPTRVRNIQLSYWNRTLNDKPAPLGDEPFTAMQPGKKNIVGSNAEVNALEQRTGKKVKRVLVTPGGQ